MPLSRTFEHLQNSGGNKITDFLAGGANLRIQVGVNGKQNNRTKKKYARVGHLNGAARRRTDMERLTIRTNEASISFECESVGDIVRRLAAYEDTGLEPEEIIELKARMEGLEK